jgi:site-specific recombinase XerD
MSDTYVSRWLRSMRRRHLSPGTIAKRASVARRLSQFAGCELEDVTRDQIEAWLDSRNLTARSRYCDISHVSAFFRWAISEELTDVDPTGRIERPKVRQGLPRPIATEDLRYAIEQATDRRLVALLTLAAFSGMRCAELSAMQVSDINGDLLLVHGKGGKDRVVPLHPACVTALRSYGLPLHGRVFDLTPWQVSHVIREHLHACGIAASAHQLRHWFATECYEQSGHDLRMVQDLLGHSSPTTTAIYTRWSRGDAGGTVDRLTA